MTIAGFEKSFAAAAGSARETAGVTSPNGSHSEHQRTGGSLPSVSHASSATAETYEVNVTDDEIGAGLSGVTAPRRLPPEKSSPLGWQP